MTVLSLKVSMITTDEQVWVQLWNDFNATLPEPSRENGKSYKLNSIAKAFIPRNKSFPKKGAAQKEGDKQEPKKDDSARYRGGYKGGFKGKRGGKPQIYQKAV